MLLIGTRVAELCLPRREALVGLQRETVRDSGRGIHHVPQEKQSRGNSIRQSVTKAIAEWDASASDSDLVTWLDNLFLLFLFRDGVGSATVSASMASRKGAGVMAD